MKVFSITFKSLDKPDVLAMFTAVADSAESAIAMGSLRLNNERGPMNWHPMLANSLDIQLPPLPVVPPAPSAEIEEIKQSKNWVLSKIVTTGDKALFEAVKPHLNDMEVAYITDKLPKE